MKTKKLAKAYCIENGKHFQLKDYDPADTAHWHSKEHADEALQRDVARMAVHIALAGEFVVAAEIGKLYTAELANFVQGGANRRIFMPTERRRLALDRAIEHFAPLQLPLLEEGAHHMNVIAAKIL